MLTSRSHTHPFRRALASDWPRLPWPLGWKSAGALALLCSTVTWASLPSPLRTDESGQWQALAITPLSGGGATGMQMAPTQAVQPLEFVAKRVPAPIEIAPVVQPVAQTIGPMRIRGRVGDGLYWSLRAAGASPETAAQYLAALATEVDVGAIAASDGFDLVLGANRQLLYAGLSRVGEAPLQLVRWSTGGEAQWIDAANADRPAPVTSGSAWPVNGHITSYFGYRYHPILHFTRFHAGVDIGASWGAPIVAAGDGQVVSAGWAGGYGRQIRIAHAGGLTSTYAHMSEMVAQPGSYVRAGQLIGYVGSSGLSTGPHVHFEVLRRGVPVNPLSVRFAGFTRAPDTHVAGAVKARLKQLLSVGQRQG